VYNFHPAAKQVPIRGVPTEWIMGSPAFARGFDDARKGVPFDWRNCDWSYERGRLFAHIAPLGMPLRIDGHLNPKAVALCEAAFDRKLII
jgi:hypothetical protein